MEIVPIKQKSVNAKPKQVSQKKERITNSTKNPVILKLQSSGKTISIHNSIDKDLATDILEMFMSC